MMHPLLLRREGCAFAVNLLRVALVSLFYLCNLGKQLGFSLLPIALAILSGILLKLLGSGSIVIPNRSKFLWGPIGFLASKFVPIE